MLTNMRVILLDLFDLLIYNQTMNYLLFLAISSIVLGFALAENDIQTQHIPGFQNKTERCVKDLQCGFNQVCARNQCQCRFGFLPNSNGGCTQMFCVSQPNSLPFLNKPNECSESFGQNAICQNGNCVCEDFFAVDNTTQRCRFDPAHSTIQVQSKAMAILFVPLAGVVCLALLLSACCCACSARHHAAKPIVREHVEEKSKPEEAKIVPRQSEYVSVPLVHQLSHAPVVPVIHHHQYQQLPYQQLPYQQLPYQQLPPTTANYLPQVMLYQQPQMFAGSPTCAYTSLPAQQAYAPMFNSMPVQQQHQQLPSPPPYRHETAPIYPNASAPEQASEQAPELPEKL